MKTVRRDWLKKQIMNGKMVGKCDHRYTDDYAMDNANNFGKTDFMPLQIIEDYDDHVAAGFLFLWADDFVGKPGWASIDEKTGIYSLYVHSNLSFSFKFKEATSY